MRKINEIREAFLGINQRNVGFVFPSNNRKDYKLADDKILAKKRMETYSIPCAKTYAIIDKVGGIPAAWNSLQKYETLAIKPSNGSGGEGILILKKTLCQNNIGSFKGILIVSCNAYIFNFFSNSERSIGR